MDLPLLVWVIFAGAVFVLAVFGGRGMLAIHAALRAGELQRLAAPPHWAATRAFGGLLAALPVVVTTGALGPGRWLAALAVGAVAAAAAPRFLASARQRAEREVLDDLPLHLDLIALALEGGGSLAGALALCTEHAPPGVLRRALTPAVLEIHAGAEPLEALRALEERLGMRFFGGLLAALRAAERLDLPLAPLLREKSRQATARRFARAEHLARTAPLRLWATLMLCIAPCTLVVLAFPVARMLAVVAGG